MKRAEAVKKSKLAALPIEVELRQAGIAIESISDFLRTTVASGAAIPILLKWLPVTHDEAIKETIVRALSVPAAKPVAALPLIRELRKLESTRGLSIKWAIGNAMAVVADDSVFSELREFVLNRRYGKAREMFVVAIGNMRNPEASILLNMLLKDDEVAGHALMAIRKLGRPQAIPNVRLFLTHEKTWVRKEAEKTIKKLVKALEKSQSKMLHWN